MATQPNPKKIVLAYSGGLDTSVILPWLKKRYPGVKLVAFAAELGHLSSPLTETRAAGKAEPVVGRIEELVAAVRHPTKIRELMLLREILDRPVDNWS